MATNRKSASNRAVLPQWVPAVVIAAVLLILVIVGILMFRPEPSSTKAVIIGGGGGGQGNYMNSYQKNGQSVPPQYNGAANGAPGAGTR